MTVQNWNVGLSCETGKRIYWCDDEKVTENVDIIELPDWEARDFLTVAYIGALGVDKELAVEMVRILLYNLAKRGFTDVAVMNMAIAVANDSFKKASEMGVI